MVQDRVHSFWSSCLVLLLHTLIESVWMSDDSTVSASARLAIHGFALPFPILNMLTNYTEILHRHVPLAQSATTCTTGRPPSWALQTRHTPEVCSSSPFTSQLIIHSSLQRSTSLPRSTTLISMAPALSV